MDPGLDPRIELGHRRVNVGETAGNLYLELGIGQMPQRCDPGQDIARDQAQRDAVRVVDDDRVVNLKAQLRSSRPPCLHRAANLRCVHAFLELQADQGGLGGELDAEPGQHAVPDLAGQGDQAVRGRHRG